jgi:pimeloyl-ACP methyl ester carboxylesterase
MLLHTILFVLLNASIIYSKSICYGDLGCYTDQYPFSGVLPWRPFAALPNSPEKIATKFILYNKQTSGLGQVISASNISASFDAAVPVKFITHGFIQNGFHKWVIEMKDAILSAEDVNVIVVDWSNGNGLPYMQATANTQVVGAVIAKLVNTFVNTLGVKASDVHLIGHSLGAHISGYAGAKIKGLGRITGLDPAGPYFEFTEPEVRLDPTDALFVEAIHTDGTATLQLGLGLMQRVGHIDYYPNGGKNQPNCPEVPGKILSAIFFGLTLNVAGIEDSTACSHSAALTFFTESIRDKSCKFTAFPCSSKAEFDAGKCMKCASPNGCNQMGYWSTANRDRGDLYLNTRNPLVVPLCLQHYSLTFYSNNLSGMKQTSGKFTITLKTSTLETSSTETFDDADVTFKPNEVGTRLISLKRPIGRAASVQSAIVSFTKMPNILINWIFDDRWSFRYIQIASGDTQEVVKLCPSETFINSSKSVEFKKC